MATKEQRFSTYFRSEHASGKPHIAFIGGYWRVSPWSAGDTELYCQACMLINALNKKLIWGRLA